MWGSVALADSVPDRYCLPTIVSSAARVFGWKYFWMTVVWLIVPLVSTVLDAAVGRWDRQLLLALGDAASRCGCLSLSASVSGRVRLHQSHTVALNE